MSEQPEADMGEARETRWVERTAGTSPTLSWEAVRAAIWEAGKSASGAEAQEAVRNTFFNLKVCDLEHANQALDGQIGLYESMSKGSALRMQPGKIKEAIEAAKQVLNETMQDPSVARSA